MHKVQPGQRVAIINIQIAVPEKVVTDGTVFDEISGILSENGICDEACSILDWRYANPSGSDYEKVVIAPMLIEEGEIFTQPSVVEGEANELYVNPTTLLFENLTVNQAHEIIALVRSMNKNAGVDWENKYIKAFMASGSSTQTLQPLLFAATIFPARALDSALIALGVK